MLRVGEKIKKRREELGLTQDELAEITGYKDRSSINKIEKGGNKLPQSKIVAFSKALKTTPSYLMGWEDADKEFKPTVKEIQGIHKYRSLDEHGKSVVEYILEEEYTRCEAAKATETAAEKTIKIRCAQYHNVHFIYNHT